MKHLKKESGRSECLKKIVHSQKALVSYLELQPIAPVLSTEPGVFF